MVRYADLGYLILFAISVLICGEAAVAGESDWQQVKTYQYGMDRKPLLAVEREVYQSLASPERKIQTAARLVAILADSQATPAGRQFAAWQLWTVGGEADVSALAKLLDDPTVADWAREALEMIPGEASLAVLRESLGKLKGRTLIGAIHSLANRRDAKAVEAITRLTKDENAETAAAAHWALMRLAGGDAQTATARPDSPSPVRRAALRGALEAAGDRAADEIVKMLSGDDPDARAVAAGYLAQAPCDEKALNNLAGQLAEMPQAGRALLLVALAERNVKDVVPAAEAAANAKELSLQLAGIHALALVGSAKHVPLLVAALHADDVRIDEMSRDALHRLSAPGVDEAMLAALGTADARRKVSLMELLAWRKSPVAVPALLAIVQEQHGAQPPSAVPGDSAQPGAAVLHVEPGLAAVAALKTLATSEDIPAMLKALLSLKPGVLKDELEKTIVAACDRIEDHERRADAVLEAYVAVDNSTKASLLPLLGRLGGARALAALREAVQSDRADMREAAIRGLCNWPDDAVAPELLEIARNAGEPQNVWALRAYVRVITLAGGERDLDTLAQLKEAMTLARGADEKRLILNRARAVRTVETLRWLLTFLDNPEVSEAACETIVDLARQRLFREPNRAEFKEALKNVIAASHVQNTTDAAKMLLAGIGWD